MNSYFNVEKTNQQSETRKESNLENNNYEIPNQFLNKKIFFLEEPDDNLLNKKTEKDLFSYNKVFRLFNSSNDLRKLRNESKKEKDDESLKFLYKDEKLKLVNNIFEIKKDDSSNKSFKNSYLDLNENENIIFNNNKLENVNKNHESNFLKNPKETNKLSIFNIIKTNPNFEPFKIINTKNNKTTEENVIEDIIKKETDFKKLYSIIKEKACLSNSNNEMKKFFNFKIEEHKNNNPKTSSPNPEELELRDKEEIEKITGTKLVGNIGYGGFSIVKLGVNETNSKKYAIKIVSLITNFHYFKD